MAADVLAVATGAAVGVPVAQRPYAPSWLDRLITGIGRLPGPTWVFYVAASVVALVFVNAEGWLGGWVPVGTFDPTQSSYAFYMVYPVALVHYLDGVAHRAWRQFRPAVDVDDAQASALEYELTTIPPRPALLWAVVAIVLNLASYAADPVAMQMTGIPILVVVLRAVSESIMSAVTLVFAYELYRQLRLVSRLTRRSIRIDLFQPGPVYAFSHLTVRAGIGLSLMAVWQLLTTPPSVNATLVSVAWIAFAMAAGLAAFVLPLWGMHGQIAAEKDRLEGGANRRLEIAIERLHAAVDTDDLSRADALNRTLASLVQEREVLAKLPTWPWQAGTAWAFVSAVGLPIGIWLVTRLLERFV